jgi:hypothetical protein
MLKTSRLRWRPPVLGNAGPGMIPGFGGAGNSQM